MRKLILAISLLGIFGCEKADINPREPFIEIENGDVVITHWLDTTKTSDYLTLSYRSEPFQRVYWSSPDSFITVVGSEIEYTSIVNYSTYTREDSTGNQVVYIPMESKGDTLTVDAKIGYEIKDRIKIIVY